MVAFLFPGQGSQVRGMGGALFDEVREYAAVERQVDALLGYSMRKLCLEDPENRLKETQYTQPALYVVNALHWYAALSKGVRPSHAAGHSLGEYNALLAAGAFDFLTGLRLVKKRGELMSQVRNGGMAAIVGLSPQRINAVLQERRANGVDVASFNSPAQTVISGPVEEIKRLGPAFEGAGAEMYMPLLVSAAFHSRCMTPAATAFADFLAGFTFQAPKFPVIANVVAQPYPVENPTQAIATLLAKQITQSVQWIESIRLLLRQGVTEFKEIGPGNVLTRLVQQIRIEKG